jgi:SH3-like domain-containing protein
MRLFLALLVSLLLTALAAACTTPPPTEEQLRAYAQYAELRATDAAASELIAAAKATEAAAVQQIAQATAAALPASAVVTATATLTPTLVITTTPPLTATGDVLAATALLTATGEITATATPTPTAIVTATAPFTSTPRALATVSITPAATVAATATPSATAAATSTPQPVTSLIESSPWAALLSGAAGQTITATLAAPTPTPAPAGQAIVTSQQANLRGGPGMAFDVLATARQGDTLDVTGSDAVQNWWQVCCVDGKPGWVSRTIVRFQGDAQAVPVVGPLLPDDLSASWAMRWECKGRGCQQDVCTGQSQAAALRVINDRWLEVQREATWDDGCGEPEDWLTQVDRYTGQERQNAANPPLFNIWQGANPGPVNRSVELAGATLALWCSETRTQEVEQTGGWTAAFEGQACYDTRSGVLALLQYVKRWLFTGATDGQTFDREYFGDYEVIQQVLLDTNAPLSGRD